MANVVLQKTQHVVFFYHVSFFSLENFSDKIRWSMDLRWQRPDKPNGFYGLKVSTAMMLNDNAVPEIFSNIYSIENTDLIAQLSFNPYSCSIAGYVLILFRLNEF